MYEVGKVYVWYNQVGEFAGLNGQETTILEGPFNFFDNVDKKMHIAWETDSYLPGHPREEKNRMVAYIGDLRPKDPPKGEQKIMDLFKTPELETA
jgi:hypothetical protein